MNDHDLNKKLMKLMENCCGESAKLREGSAVFSGGLTTILLTSPEAVKRFLKTHEVPQELYDDLFEYLTDYYTAGYEMPTTKQVSSARRRAAKWIDNKLYIFMYDKSLIASTGELSEGAKAEDSPANLREMRRWRSMDAIITRYSKPVEAFIKTGKLSRELYGALYKYWADGGDMPRHIRGQRPDEDEWVADALYTYLQDEGRITESAVVGVSDEMGGEEQEINHATFTQTKQIGDKSVTVAVNAENMDDVNRMLQLAGLTPHTSHEEVQLGTDDEQVDGPETPVQDHMDGEQSDEEVRDSIKGRLESKWAAQK